MISKIRFLNCSSFRVYSMIYLVYAHSSGNSTSARHRCTIYDMLHETYHEAPLLLHVKKQGLVCRPGHSFLEVVVCGRMASSPPQIAWFRFLDLTNINHRTIFADCDQLGTYTDFAHKTVKISDYCGAILNVDIEK